MDLAEFIKTEPVDHDAAVPWSVPLQPSDEFSDDEENPNNDIIDESSITQSALITEIAKLQSQNSKQAKEIEQLRAENEKLQNKSKMATVPKFNRRSLRVRKNESKLTGKMIPSSVGGETSVKNSRLPDNSGPKSVLQVKLSETKIILFLHVIEEN